jgi:hypothetical protein
MAPPHAITAYYDGTGSSHPKSGSRFLTLAGYVAADDVWPAFETLWHHVLAQWDEAKGVRPCEYFHEKEARHLRGHFAPARGWTREKVHALKLQLLNDCLSVMVWHYRNRFVGTSCTVSLDDMREALSERPLLLEQYREPESVCVTIVLYLAKRMLVPSTGGYVPDDASIRLYFDRGERFLNSIHNTWTRRRHEPRFKNIVSIETAEMKNTPAIQAADMLATHAHLAYNKQLTSSLFFLKATALTGVHHQYFDKARILRMLDKAMADEAAIAGDG